MSLAHIHRVNDQVTCSDPPSLSVSPVGYCIRAFIGLPLTFHPSKGWVVHITAIILYYYLVFPWICRECQQRE